MSTVTKKSLALQATLADELAIRTGLAVVQGFDATTGQPTITTGTQVAGSPGVFIEITPISWPLALDALGNAAIQYTPHRIQLCFEAISGGGSDPNGFATAGGGKLGDIGACALRGTKVEVWEETSGTFPSASTLTTANKLKATFEPQPYYPMVSDQ